VQRNVPGEFAIRGRVYAIDAVTQNGDRRSPCRQRSAVRGGVDSLRQATDDAKPRLAKMPGKLERILRAALCRVAAADDRESGQVENLRVAVDIEL